MGPLADLIKVLIVTAIMIPACISDWRKREASELHWALMGSAGMVFVALYGGGEIWARGLVVLGMALMLFDVLVDREVGAREQLIIYAVIALLFLIPIVASGWVLRMTAIPILATYVMMNILYSSELMQGGADATSLIAIGMVFQHYPDLNWVPFIKPGSEVFDAMYLFPLFVLMAALIIAAVVMLSYFVALNIRRRDIGSLMFFGYRMDLDKVPDRMVWPMQDVVDGKVVTTHGVVNDPSAVQRLREAGAVRIWVTPKIPFLIPILVGFLFIVMVGNPLFIL